MRLFVAINFDKQIRDKMIAVQERLKSAERGNLAVAYNQFYKKSGSGKIYGNKIPDAVGDKRKNTFCLNSKSVYYDRATLSKANFTREENLHLTLAFIGETEPAKIDDIKDAMNSLTVPETELIFSNIGFFRSGADKSQLWWIGAENNPKLSEFQKKLCFFLKGTSKNSYLLIKRSFFRVFL